MKTIVQKIMWLFFMAAAMMSCSKDDNNNIDENNNGGDNLSGTLLLIEEKVNGQKHLTYEYDEQNRVVIWTAYVNGGIHTIHNFTYDGSDRLIAHDRRHDGRVFLKESYSYEAGERPVSGVWIIIGNDGGVISESLIQYAYEQNTVTETVFVEDAGNFIDTYIFDNKGNLIRSEIGQGVIDYGDFDDKPGIYTRHPWYWKSQQINNYQSIKTTSGGVVLSDHIYEYTYNDAGYPVKAEVYDRATEELVETHEYTYKKAN